MNSKYKVGDIVTIKSKHDPGKEEYGYPFCFTNMMVKNYGGRSLKINSVQYSENTKAQSSGDPYAYILDGSTNTWHSSMFEDRLCSDPKKTIHVKRKKRANINTKLN